MAKLALVAPAGIVTLAGTPAAVLSLLDRATTAPPSGAGALKTTVPLGPSTHHSRRHVKRDESRVLDERGRHPRGAAIDTLENAAGSAGIERGRDKRVDRERRDVGEERQTINVSRQVGAERHPSCATVGAFENAAIGGSCLKPVRVAGVYEQRCNGPSSAATPGNAAVETLVDANDVTGIYDVRVARIDGQRRSAGESLVEKRAGDGRAVVLNRAHIIFVGSRHIKGRGRVLTCRRDRQTRCDAQRGKCPRIAARSDGPPTETPIGAPHHLSPIISERSVVPTHAGVQNSR